MKERMFRERRETTISKTTKRRMRRERNAPARIHLRTQTPPLGSGQDTMDTT